MIEQHKRCPFCKSRNIIFYVDALHSGTKGKCENCGATSGCIDNVWNWNSRPIEDALRAENDRLKIENEVLEYKYAEITCSMQFGSEHD